MFDKYKQYKKVALISIIMLIAISLALYFSPTRKVNNNSSNKNATTSTGTTEQKQEQQKKQEAENITPNPSKTENLKKEKEILDGQVYVKNNVVTGTMVIKDGVSEADIKVLADKYAKELKAEYKDMKVNVQAVQKGKNIANITIEK